MALKFFVKKKESKSRIIRSILLFQEFDIEIKDQRGSENILDKNCLVFSRFNQKLSLQRNNIVRIGNFIAKNADHPIFVKDD